MKCRLGMIVLWGCISVQVWAAQPISLGNWQDLHFVSHPALNQHLFLFELARDKAYFAEVLDELKQAQGARQSLSEAVEVYRQNGVADRTHPLFAQGQIPVLTDAFMQGASVAPEDCKAVCQAWQDTRALYLDRFWPSHHITNTRWAEEVIAKLNAHGSPVQQRLEALYNRSLTDGKHTVNVVFKPGDRLGAWTSGRLFNTVINTTQPGYNDWFALEMVFHEVAHARLTARKAAVSVAIEKAMGEAGVTEYRGLWHALMFYTVGEVVAEQLETANIDYRTYGEAEGVYSRSWSRYRSLAGRFWPAYMNGEVPMAEALKNIARGMADYETGMATSLHKSKGE